MKIVKLLLLLVISFSLLGLYTEKGFCFSTGFEKFTADHFEASVEYFPIVPFDPEYSTASESFAMTFNIFQKDWWDLIIHYVPSGFGIFVYFWDECGSTDWPTWKDWYPTDVEQTGLIASWSLSASAGSLGLSVELKTHAIASVTTDDTKYPFEWEERTYTHMGTLQIDYACDAFWGQTRTRGAGALGIPNDVAMNHDGHHIEIFLGIYVAWTGYFTTWPVMIAFQECYFIIGDDIPADTDCWLQVSEGKTNFRLYRPYPGDGGGSCPTLFVWDGADYVEEGILDIHAESDITVQHQIQNSLVLKNGVYNLQLRELDEHTSHIDQVKLHAIDYQGKSYLCPLTYAYHNELGNVNQTLLFDDDTRVDLEPTETIDLKFSPPISYSKTACFIFEINGYNMKQP